MFLLFYKFISQIEAWDFSKPWLENIYLVIFSCYLIKGRDKYLDKETSRIGDLFCPTRDPGAYTGNLSSSGMECQVCKRLASICEAGRPTSEDKSLTWSTPAASSQAACPWLMLSITVSREKICARGCEIKNDTSPGITPVSGFTVYNSSSHSHIKQIIIVYNHRNLPMDKKYF